MKCKRKIAVFCGSSAGNDPRYVQAAIELADVMVKANIGLVYGGAKVGLMGVIADRILELGGEVVGVIPDCLVEMEVAHHGLTQLHIVPSMHERKILMMELADSFILLPGGAGSLDEFFEVVTLTQLGLCHKPCGVLNTADYYHHMLAFLRHAVTHGFLKEHHLQGIFVENHATALLDCLMSREERMVEVM